MTDDEITLLACGDVFVQRADPQTAFTLVRDTFHAADLVFGNLEAPACRSDTPPTKFVRIVLLRSDPEMIPALAEAGFDLVSLANTHTMDYGPSGMVQTMEALERSGVRYVGAGRNLAEAHAPVLYDMKGIRIAFLAYHTFDQFASVATETTPGQAMVRFGIYLPPPNLFREEVCLMQEDIRAARRQADVVIVSWHWGQSMTSQLAVHQPYLGHLAVDAGADLVLGHHAHVLQGIELYRGKPICYSLGNLVMDGGAPMSMEAIVVKCVIAGGRIRRLSFLPAEGTRMGQARILCGDEAGPTFEEMKTRCAEVGSRFRVVDGEGVFTLPSGAVQRRGAKQRTPARRR